VTTWSELAAQARSEVQRVAGDPEGRLRMRQDFYREYGHATALIERGELEASADGAHYGYGRSELDFMVWEIRRGVLDPVGGSPWWSAVNLSFLFFGRLAALGHEAALEHDGAPPAVRAWLTYITSPDGLSWYRAHNTSIVTGYLEHAELAGHEARAEQVFLNSVLYRLLFAQGMVEGVEFELLGRFLADPRLPSVDLLVHLPDFYPDHYPLDHSDARHVMHIGHSLEEAAVRCLDLVLIHPQLVRLYGRAAHWNGTPFVNDWITRGEPCYPHGRRYRPILDELAGRYRRWKRRSRRRGGA
jgi:hypothetical protein